MSILLGPWTHDPNPVGFLPAHAEAGMGFGPTWSLDLRTVQARIVYGRYGCSAYGSRVGDPLRFVGDFPDVREAAVRVCEWLMAHAVAQQTSEDHKADAVELDVLMSCYHDDATR